jgi:type I restriction enzyme S subunit
MSQLPSTWSTFELKNVIDDLQAGFASGEKAVAGGLKHLRMNNISVDGSLNLDLVRTVPATLASDSHFLTKGDVLICTTNSGKLVGKCALFDLDGDFAFSNHLTRLRVNSEVLVPKFLLYQLWLLWRLGDFENKCKHWVNQSTLPKEELLDIELSVAPINEQRRIVTKLEKLLSRVGAAQERLTTIARTLKRFRQSVLAAAYSGQLQPNFDVKNGSETQNGDKEARPIHHWSKVPFSEVIASSFYGPRFSKDSYSNSGVPTIRTTDMGFDGSVTVDNSPRLRLSKEEIKKYELHHGDLLVTRTGATIGKCALYDRSLGPAIPSAYLIRFRLRPELIEPRFALFVLMSPRGQELLLGGSTAVAQPNVNATTISQFLISLPPLAEQREIVSRVEALFKTADALEVRYLSAKAHIDKLTQAILVKAFRGELVPQDPNDEPASVLVERIKSSKNPINPTKVVTKHDVPKKRRVRT